MSLGTRLRKLEQTIGTGRRPSFVCRLQTGETPEAAIARHVAAGNAGPFVLVPEMMAVAEWERAAKEKFTQQTV